MLVGITLAAALLIGARNYRAARLLVSADPPSPLLKNPAATKVDGIQAVSLPSGTLVLRAWYVPPQRGAAVVVANGTNSDRSTMLDEIRILADAGIGVLAMDWPGLGESSGQVLWGKQATDALRAAVDWLGMQPGVDPKRIGGLGFSIGGYEFARAAAQDERVRAVVLLSAPDDFSSYEQVHYSKWGLLSRLPSRWALKDSGLQTSDTALNSIAKIAPRPVFLIAESQDAEVPMWMTAKLASAAGEPKEFWVIEGTDHGKYANAVGDEYGRRLRAFFEKYLLDGTTLKP